MPTPYVGLWIVCKFCKAQLINFANYVVNCFMKMHSLPATQPYEYARNYDQVIFGSTVKVSCWRGYITPCFEDLRTSFCSRLCSWTRSWLFFNNSLPSSPLCPKKLFTTYKSRRAGKPLQIFFETYHMYIKMGR